MAHPALRLVGHEPPPPPPPITEAELRAYAPPFSPGLLSALAALNSAHSQVKGITSGQFTTVEKALQLPGLLAQVIANAQAAKDAL